MDDLIYLLIQIVLLLLFLRFLGPPSSPPTHPLPVSSPAETSRGSGDAEEKRNWQALLRFIRLRSQRVAVKR